MQREGRHLTPLQVLASAFAIAALGGVASLLNSSTLITTRTFVATAIYSGMMGFAFGALQMKTYVTDPFTLFGVAALLGLSGVKAVDLLVFAWRKLGITITAAGQKEDKP